MSGFRPGVLLSRVLVGLVTAVLILSMLLSALPAPGI